MYIAGERYRDFFKMGHCIPKSEILFMPDNPLLPDGLAGHADMSVFYDGDGDIWLARHLFYSEFTVPLKDIGLTVHLCSSAQSDRYPFDVPMNIKVSGRKFIYNSETADNEIIDVLHKKGYTGIRCRQGYSACSTLMLNETSIISADNGVIKAAENFGLDVLKISQYGISLPGYDHGFIGGCAFVKSRDTVVFTGNIYSHPDNCSIEEFIKNRGFFIETIPENTLLDIGGVIVI